MKSKLRSVYQLIDEHDEHLQSCATVAFRLISELSSSSLSHNCNPPCFMVVPPRAVSICISSFQGTLAVPMLMSPIPTVMPLAVSMCGGYGIGKAGLIFPG